MFPSKADRILSRYRPIAPKPLPLPPSGSFGTDVSSTCASLDSFTSSGKCKRSRKRRTEGSSSAKCPKTPKSDKAQVISGPSNTAGGASSLTQGYSDGAVPLRDLSQASHRSHGSMAYGLEEAVEVSKGAVREMPDMRWANCGGVGGMVAPVYVGFAAADAGNLVLQQRVLMGAEQQHHLPPSPQLQQRVSPGYLSNSGGGLIEKDVELLERAAASTVLPDRSPTVSACGSACVKGVSYVGGGFTEMIRGITRLPTAADVQSLMQVRTAPPATAVAAPGIPATGSAAMRSSPSPTRSINRDLQQRRPEHPLPTPPSHSWVNKSPPQVADVSEDDCNLVTLPLLPNVPSKLSSPPPLHSSSSSSLAEPSLHCGSHRLEPSLHHYSPNAGPSAVLSSRCSGNLPIASLVGRSGNLRGCKPFEAETPAPGHSPSLPSSKNLVGGLAPSSGGVYSSLAIANGAAVDQVYLEQVYGGSTDPVLLVDECNQVLWFNRAYDRALKSASERLCGKLAPTGPYIDPLGHPTPLGSFALPLYGKPTRAANATLWGFLKKLVIQEAELPLKGLKSPPPGPVATDSDPSSQLCLKLGESSESSSPACVEPVGRVGAEVCANSSRLTTVTLESITEFHMETLARIECLETVEAMLAAGSVPAFITDCTSKVRWVNAAFKRMLGHTEGKAWGISTSCGGGGGCGGGAAAVNADPACSSSTPELTLVCSAEKIPRSASAFSGRVNLEWMKGGKRRSMTVPCDVSRYATTSRFMETWVWKFDVAVSLCLSSPC